MRLFQILIFIFLLIGTLQGQEDKIKELVNEGIVLNDQGNYEDAILKYKEALEIDQNSTLANYELSYTYMVSGQYEAAIRYSKAVIAQNIDNQFEAYVVLGSSLDLIGNPDLAIEAYEDGLTKFPGNYLLNYNLGLTLFTQKAYENAETAAINAIKAKPTHGSSHILLSYIMQNQGQRVKSILPIYYFLMLEPNSGRSKAQYDRLLEQLGQGVTTGDENTVNLILPPSSTDNEFGDSEVLISLLAASRYTDENKKKSNLDYFIELNKELFSILGELKKEHKGFWQDLYIATFYDLVLTDNCEAFSYYISQSSESKDVMTRISKNASKMEKFESLLSKIQHDENSN